MGDRYESSFYPAELNLVICHENHIHINLRPINGVDCPELGIALNANDARDMAEVVVSLCESCQMGYHECAQEETHYACSCEDCGEAREDAVEFFNGLEDFFKSIDPDNIGWEQIEAEVDGYDAGDIEA